jgi:hypothetical protein
MGKDEGKSSLERQTLRWQGDVNTFSEEIRWKDVDRINLAQDSNKRRGLVKTAMNVKVPRIL